MKYIIAYDISDDKRRNKLSALLDKYGTRVQYSIYEIEINQTKLKYLIKKIKEQKLCDKNSDSVRFYYIHESTLENSFDLSQKRREPFENIELFL